MREGGIDRQIGCDRQNSMIGVVCVAYFFSYLAKETRAVWLGRDSPRRDRAGVFWQEAPTKAADGAALSGAY